MRLPRDLDPLLLTACLVMTLLGITLIYSAVFHSELPGVGSVWERQALNAGLAIVFGLLLLFVPQKALYNLAYPLYIASLLTLLAVLGLNEGADAARWLRLGPLSLQPSEFTKLALIVVLARYLGDCSSENIDRMRIFIGALFIILLPMGMVVRQPDLGTAVGFAAPLLPMLYWGGMSRITIFCLIAPLLSVICSFEPLWQRATPFVFAVFIVGSTGIIHYLLARLWATLAMLGVNLGSGLLTVYLWDHFLRPYQKDRIMVFLDPESDRLGAGWNIIQSKIAIGSGGLTGKGFLEGTQTKYEFLPAAHTDFIFSVLGEELGFIGAMVVLAIFLFIIARALRIAALSQNRFHSLIAIGVASMFAFQVFVNVGMTIGVMPITGLPLPFLSYGGSSLMANFLAVGLLLHVYTYRHEY